MLRLTSYTLRANYVLMGLWETDLMQRKLRLKDIRIEKYHNHNKNRLTLNSIYIKNTFFLIILFHQCHSVVRQEKLIILKMTLTPFHIKNPNNRSKNQEFKAILIKLSLLQYLQSILIVFIV